MMTGTGSRFGKDEDKVETARTEQAKAAQERQRIGFRRVLRHLRKRAEFTGLPPFAAEIERGIRKRPPDRVRGDE
jgi:hypothetical protein